jgi:hypothetical protein
MVATPLDEASDNNTEIMDAEDPLFIPTLPVPLENQRNGAYHSRIYGVHSLYF